MVKKRGRAVTNGIKERELLQMVGWEETRLPLATQCFAYSYCLCLATLCSTMQHITKHCNTEEHLTPQCFAYSYCLRHLRCYHCNSMARAEHSAVLYLLSQCYMASYLNVFYFFGNEYWPEVFFSRSQNPDFDFFGSLCKRNHIFQISHLNFSLYLSPWHLDI